jgi:hypothetical protein
MFDFEYNQDDKERQRIIGFHQCRDKDTYDCMRFSELTVEDLEELVEKKFADPEMNQNDSPTIGEFLEFVKENPGFTLHGYIITPNRNDYRVSIEGLQFLGEASKATILAFTNFVQGADEIEANDQVLYAWWD